MSVRATRARAAGAAVLERATVARSAGNDLELRLGDGKGPGALVRARLGWLPGYAPTAGDRVLCAPDEDGLVVVGVLAAAAPARVVAPDGASATLAPGGLELCDAEGRLVARFVDGTLHLQAPGDLALAAGGKLTVRARELDVAADETRFATGDARVVGRRIETVAGELRHDVERYELVADRVLEQAREVVREATELVVLRAGRLRALVADVFDLRTRRSVLRSDDDTSIDGRKILLG